MGNIIQYIISNIVYFNRVSILLVLGIRLLCAFGFSPGCSETALPPGNLHPPERWWLWCVPCRRGNWDHPPVTMSPPPLQERNTWPGPAHRWPRIIWKKRSGGWAVAVPWFISWKSHENGWFRGYHYFKKPPSGYQHVKHRTWFGLETLWWFKVIIWIFQSGTGVVLFLTGKLECSCRSSELPRSNAFDYVMQPR